MATSAQARPAYPPKRFSLSFENKLRSITPKVLVTLLGAVLMIIFLMPLGYMLTTAFKDDGQASAQRAPLWPARIVTYNYQGQDLPLYNVPTADGMKQYALVKGFREDSNFVDPAHPEKGPFDWTGRYKTLDPVYTFAPTLLNFQMAWDQVNFGLLFRNTLIIAILSTIGTMASSVLVAYGFARFPIPGKNILFIILIWRGLYPAHGRINGTLCWAIDVVVGGLIVRTDLVP